MSTMAKGHSQTGKAASATMAASSTMATSATESASGTESSSGKEDVLKDKISKVEVKGKNAVFTTEKGKKLNIKKDYFTLLADRLEKDQEQALSDNH